MAVKDDWQTGESFTAADANSVASAVNGKADTSSLAAVATSGAYSDLSGTPTLGTAAATDSTAYATAAQGALADSATQPGDLAAVATTGAYSSLSGTPEIPDALTDLDTTVTGAQLNADHTKLSGIASGAEVNVQPDWNAASGDAAILNKPTIPSSLSQLSGTVSSGQIASSAVTNSKLGAGAITDAKVSASAAIALSKLAAGNVISEDGTTLKVWRGTQAQLPSTRDANTIYLYS